MITWTWTRTYKKTTKNRVRKFSWIQAFEDNTDRLNRLFDMTSWLWCCEAPSKLCHARGREYILWLPQNHSKKIDWPRFWVKMWSLKNFCSLLSNSILNLILLNSNLMIFTELELKIFLHDNLNSNLNLKLRNLVNSNLNSIEI